MKNLERGILYGIILGFVLLSVYHDIKWTNSVQNLRVGDGDRHGYGYGYGINMFGVTDDAKVAEEDVDIDINIDKYNDNDDHDNDNNDNDNNDNDNDNDDHDDGETKEAAEAVKSAGSEEPVTLSSKQQQQQQQQQQETQTQPKNYIPASPEQIVVEHLSDLGYDNKEEDGNGCQLYTFLLDRFDEEKNVVIDNGDENNKNENENNENNNNDTLKTEIIASLQADLKAYHKGLQKYNELVQNFSPVPDVMESIVEITTDPNDSSKKIYRTNHKVCETLRLHPDGLDALFLEESKESTKRTRTRTRRRKLKDEEVEVEVEEDDKNDKNDENENTNTNTNGDGDDGDGDDGNTNANANDENTNDDDNNDNNNNNKKKEDDDDDDNVPSSSSKSQSDSSPSQSPTVSTSLASSASSKTDKDKDEQQKEKQKENQKEQDDDNNDDNNNDDNNNNDDDNNEEHDEASSKYKYKYNYNYDSQSSPPGTLLSYTPKSGYLEPLLPPMRHHKICEPGKKQQALMDLDYLVHDFEHSCRKLTPTSRRIFIDMGASLSFHSTSKVPVVELLEQYERFGMLFDHIYGFEITFAKPEKVFETLLPEKYMARYHWINVGVDATPRHKLNPLHSILQQFTRDDFVVVKLDIDTSFIERPLAEQLLDDPVYHDIVDHFYFEHHVHLAELEPYWKGSMEGTVGDSLRLFHGLRQRGIPAHFWP